MLRPLATATAAALVLAACGDSNNTPAPSPATLFAGTIMGTPFTPAEATALVLSTEATCTYSGITATATGIAFGFSTSTGLCKFIQDNGTCTNRANATTVSILVVRANTAVGGHPGPVQPGTYAVYTGVGLPGTDGQGNLIFAVADITKTIDASCTEPTTPSAVSGTVRIDTIDSTHVTGSANITFSDGTTHVAGSFDVPTCAFATDVCAPLTCPTPPGCKP